MLPIAMESTASTTQHSVQSGCEDLNECWLISSRILACYCCGYEKWCRVIQAAMFYMISYVIVAAWSFRDDFAAGAAGVRGDKLVDFKGLPRLERAQPLVRRHAG